jgi:phosphoserine phosphatase RsbU/P
MARMARVAVIDPSGVRKEVPVTPFPFRIGRQAGNELTLRDSRISRQQAQIVNGGGTLVLEDLSSRHGTFVNGKKILRHELQPQDSIDFGAPDSYRLIFLGSEATLEEMLERADAPAAAHATSRELYHLGVLLDVARSLGTGLSLEDILITVVDAAIQVTRTERGVLLLTGEHGQLKTAVARDAQRGTLNPEQVQISSGVLKRVVATRRELIVSDTGDDSAMQQQASVARLQLHTVVAIPVDKLPVIETLDATISTRQSELLGVLYMDSHLASSAFTDLDREVLRNLAREAATVIENARLFASARDKARMDHEIAIASQIQRELLPKTFPQLPEIAVSGSTVACLSVGGDCFDVVELPGGRYGFFVGDVAGKGITAALLATLLQGVFYTTATLDIPLAEVASRVNRYLCLRSTAERYATLFYGVLDPSGRFEYVNAGHVPPLIRRAAGEVVALTEGSVPVGLFVEAEYASAAAQMHPGDYLVIYTDGVSEAANVAHEFFGEERVQQILAGFSGANVHDLEAAILNGVRSFTEGAAQNDDITLVTVQCRPPAGAAAPASQHDSSVVP